MQSNQDQDFQTKIYECNIVLIGNENVGKTQLVSQLINQFKESYEPTVGAGFFTKSFVYAQRSKTIMLKIWDTSGQEVFRSLIDTYIKKATSCIIVYDLTNRKSFEDIQVYLDKLAKFKNMQIILAGTKSDLAGQRKVTTEELIIFAKEKKLKYKELSAKDNIAVGELFQLTADFNLKCIENNEFENQLEQIQPQSTEPTNHFFLKFLKHYWWKMLVGALIVTSLVIIGVATGGAVPMIAAGIAAGIGVSLAAGASIGLTSIIVASLVFGAAMGILLDKFVETISSFTRKLIAKKNKGFKKLEEEPDFDDTSTFLFEKFDIDFSQVTKKDDKKSQEPDTLGGRFSFPNIVTPPIVNNHDVTTTPSP